MQKEHEPEIRKLVNVLRRTARMATQAMWSWGSSEQSQDHAARYGAQQYNRILQRLQELDPSVSTIFGPLDEHAPLEVVGMACRQLAAYYEDELEEAAAKEGRHYRRRDWGSFYETAYEAGPFKILFGRSFKDLEELGRMIRECMPPWMRGEECQSTREESKPSSSSGTTTEAKGVD